MTIPLKHRTDGLGEFEPDDVVPIEHGGTGATTAEQARQNLGIVPSTVEWVPVEQVGFLNTIAVENVLINGVSHGIELARIDGNLWVRGMLNHKYYGSALPIFTVRDKNYKVFASGPSYAPVAFITFASGNDNGAIKYMSNMEVYDEQTAIDVDQVLAQQYTFIAGLFYIPAQAVGKLVL